MIKNIIFDLDGTLLDTSEGVIESVKYAIDKLGYSNMPDTELFKFVGPPIQESFMKYYGCNRSEAQIAAGYFRNYYKTTALYKAKPYKNIYNMMKKLKLYGYKLAVATYKREDYALKLLNHFHISDYCRSMHGADNQNKLSKSDIINICITELIAEHSQTVLIGDTLHDATGAENAGIAFIGVTYGFGFKSKQEIDKYCNIGCAENVIDIIKILNCI